MNFVKLRSEGSSETEGRVTEPRKGSDSLKRGLNSKEASTSKGVRSPACGTLQLHPSRRPPSDAHAEMPPRCGVWSWQRLSSGPAGAVCALKKPVPGVPEPAWH